MRVKEVLILLVLLLATITYAAPDSTITLSPLMLYESNSKLFNLTIDNMFKSEVIDQLSITIPGFTIQSITEFQGWNNNFTQDSIMWHDGDIETNAIELFQFEAKAGLVDENTSVDIEIITENGGDDTTDIIPLTIINDYSAPVIENNIPQDNGFLRAEITDQEVSVDTYDDETGIKNVTFFYHDCSANATNVSFYDITLNCENNTCTNNVDLEDYEEGDELCFSFRSYNNAEDYSEINGSAGFDGTAPEVELLDPDNGEYVSSNTDFRFNATDNLAPTLRCSLKIENEIIDEAIVNNGDIADVNYDLENASEGEHDWKIICKDWVDLEGESETRSFIIDRTMPEIALNYPENNSIIGDSIMIDIDVSDNYEIDNVDYSISLNSSELAEGSNTLIVNATDKAGNSNIKEFVFIVDRTAPTIDVISPEDNSSSDVHVNFTFDIDDNLDETLNCTIYRDGTEEHSDEFNINETNGITRIWAMDDYEWNIVCEDDAGNSVDSGIRRINVTDLTGPDILSNVEYAARTEDKEFDVNITDISGVDSVIIMFNGTELDIENDGDLYSGIIETDLSFALGNYSLIIDANDSLGNPNSYVDEFILIQGYLIDFNITSPVDQGDTITVEGTATLDDGNSVPEDHIELLLPSENVNISIVNNSFSYSFTESQGTYDITARIISEEGHIHSKTKELVVNGIGGSSDSGSDDSGSLGGSGGSSGGGLYCGDGTCNADETCESCEDDCGVCGEEQEDEDNEEAESSSGGSFCGDGLCNSLEDCESCEDDCGVCGEERVPEGVGAGSSLFSKITASPLSWILFLLLMVTLLLLSLNKGNKKPKDKIDWTGYFE